MSFAKAAWIVARQLPEHGRRWRSLSMHAALAVGIACSMFAWGPAATLLFACFVASVGTTTAATMGTTDARWLRTSLERGTNIGLAATALLGAVTVFGPLGLLIALPLLGAHPVVTAVARSYLRDRFSGGNPPPGTGVQPGWDHPPVSVDAWGEPASFDILDDAALCKVWRHSYVQLTSALSAEDRLRIADRRRRCLDELEHRNPDGFAAWLDSGARAASDPLPFLRRTMPPPG